MAHGDAKNLPWLMMTVERSRGASIVTLYDYGEINGSHWRYLMCYHYHESNRLNCQAFISESPHAFRGSLSLTHQEPLLPICARGDTEQIKQQFLKAELFEGHLLGAFQPSLQALGYLIGCR